MPWAACRCGVACGSACTGRASGRCGGSSRSGSPIRKEIVWHSCGL